MFNEYLKENDVVLYIHGKDGSIEEAEHYKTIFPSCNVFGFEYKSFTPWETGKEIREEISTLKTSYDRIILIANSVGVFFSMNAGIDEDIDHAYFISPIVNMEKLIMDMMSYAGVTESELQEKGRIQTDLGEELSWEYLSYVRKNPIKWKTETDILYGSKDNMTSVETVMNFAKLYNADLTVMEGGEHWFHTEEQMQYLDDWIIKKENQWRKNDS